VTPHGRLESLGAGIEGKRQRWQAAQRARVQSNGGSGTAGGQPLPLPGAAGPARGSVVFPLRGGGSSRCCEDCGKPLASTGMLAEADVRWCGACVVGHPNEPNHIARRCEDCRQPLAAAGLLAEAGVRWCGVCAAAHCARGGARGADALTCEDCSKKLPRYGALRPHPGRACLPQLTGLTDTR
jgi:hypothetical protein